MNEHEAYEIIKKQLCKEAIQIAEQIQKNGTMSLQDLDRIDKIYHAKKSMLTAKAMEDADEYSEGGMSGRRYDGYNEGYDRGYSEAMNRMSGRRPMPHYPVRP